MSHEANTLLEEEACELLEEVSGTLLEGLILKHLKNKDYDELYHDVVEAKKMIREDVWDETQ